ncbi:glycoside hydrolase family 20 zincin-like fold domain-containing protein [Chryseobacterium sp. P1-3]|uniref:glycoside hydrolase family 20 zincin-like fold domain-containing protein n=1 Tax=Chryseobacterium sp. (strain P1-3) TaxID=1517683 RepID=UPI001EE66375|nr:glycoside hydrolase family 20 zincin-like fold domain-containing protein [Chryseobacterium sp. P1-3]
MNLIPYPQKVETLKGEFTIPATLLLSHDLPKEETEYLRKRVESSLPLRYAQKGEIAHITNSIISPASAKDAEQKKEYYSIEISPKQIHIKSYTRQGYFLALQTLIQLFEDHKTDKKTSCYKNRRSAQICMARNASGCLPPLLYSR